MFSAVTIEAERINAINGTIVYGAPSPFTYFGFVHHLIREANILNGQKPENQKNEFMVVVHDFEELKLKNTYNQLKSSERESKGSTQADIPRAYIRFTVIFEASNINSQDIRLILSKMRFAGGTIRLNTLRISVGDSFLDVWGSVPKGYIPNEHCLKELINTEKKEESVKNYIDYLSAPRKGFVSPSLIGYRLLEEPTEREMVRGDLEHAFAEPFFGAIEYKLSKKYNIDLSYYNQNKWCLIEGENTIKLTTIKEL